MKAAVLEAPNIVECKEIENPVPKPNEVLVKVAFCGVCGSDIPRVFQGASKYYPNVLGHEFSGEVIEVGSDADESLLGARVAGIPLIPCGECDECDSGNYSLCGNYSFVGSRRFGAFAQYVAIPQQNVFRISDDVTFLEGAIFEPATVAMHAIDLARFKEGSTAVIVGCGTIGILAAQILKALGASKVVGVGRGKERLHVAELSGAFDLLVSTLEDGWRDNLSSSGIANGFDYVFDASGSATAMVDSFSLAAPRGTVCYIGTPKKPMQFSVQQWEQLNRGELSIVGSWMSYSAPFPGSEWERVAELFANGKLRITQGMVDEIYPLSAASEAFARFSPGSSVNGKVLVDCSKF